METTEKLKNIADKRKQLNQIKDEIQKESSEIFDQFIKEIFTKSSKLESFGWRQYTPYFNDGSTCIFSANTDYLYINGVSYEEADWYEENNITNWGTWNPNTRKYEGQVKEINQKFDKELRDITDEISEFLRNFDDDFFLNKFGDHVEISVKKDGISVEDCDHD